MIRTEDHRVWHWRGMSAFLLFWRFLRGEDLTPLLQEYVELGANTLRVFGMLGWDTLSPRFVPSNWPRYVDALHEFLELLATWGLRVEWVTFGDAQIVMPDEREQQAFADMTADVLDAHWNGSFNETANEPFKNGVNTRRVVPHPTRVLRASGNYDAPDPTSPGPNPFGFDHLEYQTIHPERKAEWMRGGKELLEWRDGYGATATTRAFAGVGCPVVADEAIGADEVDIPGKRSNVPEYFGQFAGGCALMGLGATFHSTDALNAVRLRPIQRQCAWAFFTAFLTIPPEAQLAAYARGDADGYPAVGEMALEHFDDVHEHTDDGALRTFCKHVGDRQYCVAIRPGTHWTAQGRGGWRVVDEPARGLVVLA